MEFVDFFLKLIQEYGYIIVFFAIMLESTGVPLPGETALVVAAAIAGTGYLNIYGVIAAAAAGAIIGDAGGYWVGRKLGRPFLDKHGKWFHLTSERMFQLEKLFVKHGAMTVFFGRFFSLLRTYAALFAGVWKMSYITFLIFNALGGIIWASIFGTLGFVFGQNLPLLEKTMKTVGWALSIPIVCILFMVILWHWMVKHQTLIKKWYASVLDKMGYNYFVKRFSWQIHWLLRHWTAAQYTIMHITLGLTITCLSVYAFVRMTRSVFFDKDIIDLDSRVFEIMQGWATPLSTAFFQVVTSFGSYGLSIAAITTIILFVVKRRWVNAITMGAVVLGGQILVMVLKVAFARQSPVIESSLLLNWLGFSFPSGHVMGSLIVYGMLAYFLILWLKKWVLSTGIVLITMFIVLLIAFSRIYLGENYLSDVLCGLAGGSVWLSFCLTALELLRRGQVGDRRRHKRMVVKVESNLSG